MVIILFKLHLVIAVHMHVMLLCTQCLYAGIGVSTLLLFTLDITVCIALLVCVLCLPVLFMYVHRLCVLWKSNYDMLYCACL